jgi:hypothetical protein
MMEKVFDAYTVDAHGKAHEIAFGSDLTEQQVGEAVRALAMKEGTARIDISPEPEVGPYKVILYAEDGKYLIWLEENDANGEYHFRTLNDDSREYVQAYMHGELFPNSDLTEDIDLAARIFMEFYRTGDVSGDLLSFSG